jgi:CRISPR-associated exonuclease Cas4
MIKAAGFLQIARSCIYNLRVRIFPRLFYRCPLNSGTSRTCRTLDRLLYVSDIVKTHFCPVRFSLEKDEEIREPGRYVICKQLSYHLPGVVDPDQVWEEVLLVMPTIDPSMRGFLQDCIEACAGTVWRKPVQTDVPVKSGRYGIAGRVDKLFEDPVSFAIVRAGRAPPLGVYPADRLRIAAYALCLGETLGRDIGGGSLEYIPGGETRLCNPQPRDRRALMTALKTARRIIEGEIPAKPVDATRCLHCPHGERCAGDSRARRLSDLL